MIELPEDGSTLMVGIPGCGKTYTAMIHGHDERPEYSVFFNTMRKSYGSSPRVTKLDDEAIKKMNEAGHITVDTDEPEIVQKWIEYFEAVWNRSTMGPLRVYIDETDEYARCYSHDSPVERVFTKDRNRGILGVAICQSHSGQISAIIKKNAHAYFVWRLHPGEFAEYGQRFYGLPQNPSVNPGKFSPYYRYSLGKLYYSPTEGVENPVALEGEDEPEDDDEDDDETEDDENELPDEKPGGDGAVQPAEPVPSPDKDGEPPEPEAKK
jgi:hypothetical protein